MELKLQTPPLTLCGQAQDLPLQGWGCCTPSEHPGVWSRSLGVCCSSNFNRRSEFLVNSWPSQAAEPSACSILFIPITFFIVTKGFTWFTASLQTLSCWAQFPMHPNGIDTLDTSVVGDSAFWLTQAVREAVKQWSVNSQYPHTPSTAPHKHPPCVRTYSRSHGRIYHARCE